MRLLKVAQNGPPSVVWLSVGSGLLHVWVGPVGAHLPLTFSLRGAGLSWCSDWHLHPNTASTAQAELDGPSVNASGGEGEARLSASGTTPDAPPSTPETKP